MRLHIRPFFLICVIKHTFFSWIICRFSKCPYLCNVFFIVLDLRLTKVGVQRYSFFYAHVFHPLLFRKHLFYVAVPFTTISAIYSML